MNIEDLISKTLVEPRDYQKRVITKTLKHYLEDNLNSILIESPCGSGKTVMSLLIAKYMQDKLNLKVGWLSQRKNLLIQSENENITKCINLSVDFISMYNKNPPMVDMLVVDEAQHDACDSCAHIHNVIRPKYILGCTATPFRSDRVKLCFDKVIKDAGIKALIEQGYLSKYHHYTIDEYTVDSVIDTYVRGNWGKTVIYFHTIKQCREAEEILDSYNISCEVVTGSSDREEQINKLKSGRVNVLLNCMVLTEGFNYSELNTVFCKPSCRGLTVQMAGRVFRKSSFIPFKNVVQCKDTKWPFLKTALPVIQYIRKGDEWRTIGSNDNVRCASRNVIKSLAHINVQLPKILTEKKEKQRRHRDRII